MGPEHRDLEFRRFKSSKKLVWGSTPHHALLLQLQEAGDTERNTEQVNRKFPRLIPSLGIRQTLSILSSSFVYVFSCLLKSSLCLKITASIDDINFLVRCHVCGHTMHVYHLTFSSVMPFVKKKDLILSFPILQTMRL